MKVRQVLFSVEAEAELLQIYDWIADKTAPDVALAYVVRVQEFCQRLEVGSERGRSRDDIRPGLRIIGFERRSTIVFVVDPERVGERRPSTLLFAVPRSTEIDRHGAR
jgi:toxin ParE1/3/4